MDIKSVKKEYDLEELNHNNKIANLSCERRSGVSKFSSFEKLHNILFFRKKIVENLESYSDDEITEIIDFSPSGFSKNVNFKKLYGDQKIFKLYSYIAIMTLVSVFESIENGNRYEFTYNDILVYLGFERCQLAEEQNKFKDFIPDSHFMGKMDILNRDEIKNEYHTDIITPMDGKRKENVNKMIERYFSQYPGLIDEIVDFEGMKIKVIKHSNYYENFLNIMTYDQEKENGDYFLFSIISEIDIDSPISYYNHILPTREMYDKFQKLFDNVINASEEIIEK